VHIVSPHSSRSVRGFRLLLVTLLRGCLLGVVLLAPRVAQAAAKGTVSGVVTDSKTKKRIPEALVILQCTCLQTPKETQTNAEGLYAFRDLPPGTYTIQILVGQADQSKVATLQRDAKFRADFSVDPTDEIKRVVKVKTRPIKQSTAGGRSISLEEFENIPIGTDVGRDFTQVVEASPNATRDAAGIAIAGTTGAESKYTVDGANVNNPSFGTVGASIVQEFMEEVEVQESGFEAEYGGGSGGQVQARRVSGTNTLRGVARFTYSPRLAQPRYILATDNAVRAVENPDHRYQAVVRAGGPILKDRLFWSAGISLNGLQNSLVQTFHSRVNKDGIGGFEDCPYENGANDCADGGNYIETEKFAEQRFRTGAVNFGYFAGLDWTINPRHRLAATVLGGPSYIRRTYRRPPSISAEGGPDSGAFGTQLNADPLGGGLRSANGVVNDNFGWDRANFTSVGMTYDGRVLDDTLEIDAGIAYSQFTSQSAWKLDDPSGYDTPVTIETDSEGADLFGLLDREGATSKVSGVDQACNNRGLPGLACPVRAWVSGGVGEYYKDIGRRVEGNFSLTHFFNAAGSHQLKYGTQIEHVSRDRVSQYSGHNESDFYDNCPDGQAGGGEWCYDPDSDVYNVSYANRVDNHRAVFVDSDDPNTRVTYGYGRVRREQGELRAIASPIGAGARVSKYDETLSSQNYAVFLQDRWAIRSNLFLSLGVRWDIQDMRDIFGERALLIWDSVAPRVGVVYDWTEEGKSRLYASYGWFYQTLPLQLNSRVFGGTVGVNRTFRLDDCQNRTTGQGFSRFEDGQPTEWCTDFNQRTTGLLEGAVVPELKGAYVQRFQIGYEHEVIEDLVLGVSWLHSNQGRVVEDVSTDGGGNFIIANPGVGVDEDDIAAQQAQCDELQAQHDAMRDSPTSETAAIAREADRCRYLVDAYSEVGTMFSRPTRNYDAFTFEVRKRFAKNWLLVANYTYSRLVGNYEGFVDPVSGAVNLGASTQYDVPDLVRNAFGPLSYDSPHRIKLDGFYSFDLRAAGRLTLGTSFRFNSGYPISMRAGHNLYPGLYPVYVVPRGAGGRVQPNYLWNLSASYAYPLRQDLELEIAARLINVTNSKAVLRVDEVYTFQNTRPIAGGDLSDLKHARIQDSSNPQAFYDRTIVAPQGNFGVEEQFQFPLSASFEVQVRF